MIKKSVLALLLLALTVSGFPEKNPQGPQGPIDPPVTSYLVVNVDTGDVLIQKNPKEPHAPASLAKMMTLYITMEAVKKGRIRWDQIYTVPKRISLIGGSEAKLWPGEKIAVRDLFKAAAVGSANDAAAALAEIISGTQALFVDEMNQKAKALGLANTAYRSPHGLPVRNGVPGDTTTAVDLAKLTLAILRYQPEILQYTEAKETYIRKGKWRFFNTNKLIGKYPGMTGLKTGYTDEAGFCLVATAKQGNLSLVSVVLGAKSNKERFLYTRQLLDYGFQNFQNVFIPCKGKRVEVSIPNSTDALDPGVIRDNLFFMVPKEQASSVKFEIFKPTEIEAPLTKGQKIAEYVATVNGKIFARQDILAENDIEKKGVLRRLFGGWNSSLGPTSFTKQLEDFIRILIDLLLTEEDLSPSSSFRVVKEVLQRLSSHSVFSHYENSEIYPVLWKTVVEKFENEGALEKGLDFLYDVYVEALIEGHPLATPRFGFSDFLFLEYLRMNHHRAPPQSQPLAEIEGRLAELLRRDTNYQTGILLPRNFKPGQVSLHIGIFPVPGLALVEALQGLQVYGIDPNQDNISVAHEVAMSEFSELPNEGCQLPKFFQFDAQDLDSSHGFPANFADHIDMRALFGGSFSSSPEIIINNILRLLKEGGTVLVTDNYLNEATGNPTEVQLLEMISKESREWDIEWQIQPLHLLHYYRTHIYLATLKKKKEKPPIPDEKTILLGARPIRNVSSLNLPRRKRILLLEHSTLDANAYAGNLLSRLERENRIERLTLSGMDSEKLTGVLQKYKPDVILFPHDRQDLYPRFQAHASQSGMTVSTFSYVSLEAPLFQNLFFPFSESTAEGVMHAIRAHQSQIERTAYDSIFDLSTQVAARKAQMLLGTPTNMPHAHPFKVAFIQDGQLSEAPADVQYNIGTKKGPKALVIDPVLPLLAVSPHADDLEIAAGGLVRSLLETAQDTSRPRVLNWIFGTGDEFGVQWSPRHPATGLSNVEQTVIKRTVRRAEAQQAAFLLSRDKQGQRTPGRMDVSVFALPSASQHPQSENPVLNLDHPQVIADMNFVRTQLETLYKEYEAAFKQGATLTVVLPHGEDDHPHHRMSTLLAVEALKNFSQEKGINVQLFFYTAPWAGRFNTYFVSPMDQPVFEGSPKRMAQKISIARLVKQSLGLILGELMAGFGQKPLSPKELGGIYAERLMRKTFTPQRSLQSLTSLPTPKRSTPVSTILFEKAA